MHGAPITFRPDHPSDTAGDEARALLAAARALQAVAATGRLPPLLRNRNFGLLCGTAPDAGQALFRAAVEELGGRVSQVRPPPSDAGAPDIRNTARVLGHLYDGLECQGVDAATVRRLGQDAGIPVHDGLALDTHPSAWLAGLIEGPGTAAQKRRLVVQAVLLEAVR